MKNQFKLIVKQTKTEEIRVRDVTLTASQYNAWLNRIGKDENGFTLLDVRAV